MVSPIPWGVQGRTTATGRERIGGQCIGTRCIGARRFGAGERGAGALGTRRLGPERFTAARAGFLARFTLASAHHGVERRRRFRGAPARCTEGVDTRKAAIRRVSPRRTGFAVPLAQTAAQARRETAPRRRLIGRFGRQRRVRWRGAWNARGNARDGGIRWSAVRGGRSRRGARLRRLDGRRRARVALVQGRPIAGAGGRARRRQGLETRHRLLVPHSVFEPAQPLGDVEESKDQPEKGDRREHADDELADLVGQQQQHALEADGLLHVPKAQHEPRERDEEAGDRDQHRPAPRAIRGSPARADAARNEDAAWIESLLRTRKQERRDRLPGLEHRDSGPHRPESPRQTSRPTVAGDHRRCRRRVPARSGRPDRAPAPLILEPHSY